MVAATKRQKPKGKASTSKPMKSVKQKIDLIGKPKYSEMIKYAINSLKDRRGSSRQAILKFILEFYDVGNDKRPVNNYLKQALRAGVKNGKLKQLKGTGASGSFRLGDLNDKKTITKTTKITAKPDVKKTRKETLKIKKEKPEKTMKMKVKKERSITKTAKGKQPRKKTTSNKKTPTTGRKQIKKEKKGT